MILILTVNTVYLFCHSGTSISTLIPTEIKHSLYGLTRNPILDLIPSSTRYHFSKLQQKSTVEHNITSAVMKIFFKALLKSG